MTERETTSDGSLLETFSASGDEASFDELVRRHGRMVCGVCRRVLTDHHEAEDVAQAVFLTLARKSPWVRRNSDLGGWLHHVARCLAINTLKARVRRSRREEKAMRRRHRDAFQGRSWKGYELQDTTSTPLETPWRLREGGPESKGPDALRFPRLNTLSDRRLRPEVGAVPRESGA